MKLTWLGHSCFKLEADNYTIILDPFEDGSVEGLNNIRESADLVLCSHEHHDHNARNVVTLVEGNPSPFKIETISTYHDDKKGSLRGDNIIHIITYQDMRIAHAGDLGCKLTDEQIRKLKDIDVWMTPIGGYFTIDAITAKQIVDEINPHIVIPMHYRSVDFGFGVLDTLDSYTNLCNDVVTYDKNNIELSKDLPKQTAVLTYQK